METQHKSEKEFFIKKRELGELFDSTYSLDVNLWRGQKTEQRAHLRYTRF